MSSAGVEGMTFTNRPSYYQKQLHLLHILTFTSNSYHTLYDKRDASKFDIINFRHLDNNIPATPTDGVCMSQLVRNARACFLYSNIKQRHRILSTQLLNQDV